jgi:polar amino acid transport system substrate-binding protein
MNKICIFAVTLLLLISPASWSGEIERIREKGEITVSLNRGYPPFCIEKDGKVFGLDVDLANLLADYLSVKVKFIRPEKYDQQIPKLLNGESDIIIAAMTRTVERGLKVNFSAPYFEVSQAALARRDLLPAGANSYFDLLEIKGLRLGVKVGTTHEHFARELFPATALKPYPTAEAAADALINRNVDAMVADSPFVRVWRNTHVEHYREITALLEPVTREFYAFAIRRGDSEFLNWLNLFVDQIHADGTLELLKHEYFDKIAWATGRVKPEERLSRAQFLKNRFIANRKAMIEQRREALQGKGDNYE